jgi:hypothetical protein
MHSVIHLNQFDCAAALAVKRKMEEAEQPEWRNMNNK